MSSSECNDLDSLLLEPFQLANRKIVFQAYAGGGKAGYVFNVRIGEDEYALKMFKFDHPELNVTRLKGRRRRALCDPFFIECRANGTLIQQGLNGQITPFCYGWIDVPKAGEMQVAKRFNIQPFLWDRPDLASDQRVRGILFKWIDGKPLSQISINSNIAAQARTHLKALHGAQIAHGDLAASNFLVHDQDADPQVHLLDLSASISLPHVKFSAQELKQIQQRELQLLEVGFALLSRNPINRGLCVADLSSFCQATLDDLFAESQFIKHLWAPPQPTCWQGRS